MGSLGIEIRGDKRGEGCIFVLTMLWAAHQFVFDDVELEYPNQFVFGC